jgi:peptidyl-dipeptidase Dcp
MSKNPLLAVSRLPNKAPPFAKIKNSHYMPAVEAAIKEARKNVDVIKNNKAEPDFKNTIVALETAAETLGDVTGVFYNMLGAVGGDNLHALAAKIGPVNAAFSNDISLDEKLFARVRAVYIKRRHLKLTPEQDMLLEETYKGFVRGGALLNAKQKKRLRELSAQLSVLSPAFTQNVSKSSEDFELVIKNKKDLAGLPASAIEAAAFAAKEKKYKNAWRFTLDVPSLMPFLQYADSRTLREKLWRAYASRAWKGKYDNTKNVLKIVRLKDERAKLLGYKNHAEYVLEQRMAQKPETVLAFIEKLRKAYKPAAKKDFKALQAYARKTHGVKDLKPWDIAYYSEKFKEQLFKFSDEELRPYFPLDDVLSGTFDHFSKLFNLTFKPAKGYEVWHKDVKAFEVFDKSSKKFVGTLFADFHPRVGKNNGAWMTSFREQGLYRGKVERPVIAIVCNFTKPTPSKPSLLTHDEVLTLFHEMGHAMHGLLSRVTYRSMAGTNVLWDFVELPSQVQENWCYEKTTLDMFAGHYKTGKKIPPALIQKLRASKNYMGGWAGLRQVILGHLDMAWHTADPKKIKDVASFEDKQLKHLSMFPRLAGPTSVSFSHIFAGGYSAGYYSYKWAEVLDADTFELFLKRGLYHRKTAEGYKNHILAMGGSEHPRVLYKRFRGRAADPNALLRREGLLKKAA